MEAQTDISVAPRRLAVPKTLKTARVLLIIFGILSGFSFLSSLLGWMFAREQVIDQYSTQVGLAAGGAQAVIIASMVWTLAMAIGQLVFAAKLRDGGPRFALVLRIAMALVLAVMIAQMVAFGVPTPGGTPNEVIFALSVWTMFVIYLLILVLSFTPGARDYFAHNTTSKPTW